MSFERGSEWRKWDLHVHTPSSIVQHYGGDNDEVWEKYIQDIENLSSEFKVLGINDYLFLDGYSKLKKEKEQNGRLSNIELLLPVVEFRIEKFAGVNFGALQRINLHVIFSNEITIETIKSQFLNTLEQSYQIENGGEAWTRAITRKSVSELGERIIKNVPEEQRHKYGSPLTEGFNNLNVKEEQIFKALEKDCFKDKFLIAIGKTEWDELKWTDASIITKKDIINKASIIFTSAQSIETFNSAKTKLGNQGVNDLLLDCSDAHRFSDDSNKDRIGKCFTWIKANPTFEGLKQIIYEPSRVYIGENKPQSAIHKLEEIQLDFNENTKWDNDKFCFANFKEPIKFSPYLNCVIGGRGTGKSTLLNLIASKIGKENKNFFLKLDEKNIVSRVKFIPDIVENIEYLAQNEIEDFAKDSTKFTKAIFERLDKKSNFELSKTEAEITKKLNIFNEQINLLKSRVDKHLELRSKKNELKKLENIIKTFNDKQYSDNKEKLQNIQKELVALENSRTLYKQLFDEINDLIAKSSKISDPKNIFDEYYNEYVVDLEALSLKYKTKDYLEVKQKQSDLKLNNEAIQKEISDYFKTKNMTEDNIKDTQNAITNIESIKNDIAKLKLEIVATKKQIIKFELTSLDTEITGFNDKLEQYLNIINEIFSNIAIKNSSEVKIIKVQYQLSNELEDSIVEEFIAHLSKDIIAKIDKSTFKNYLKDVSITDVIQIKKASEFIAKIQTRQSQTYRVLEEIFSSKLNFSIYKLIIQKKLKDIQSNKILKVFYDNKELENSSFGQRCTAVIIILLSLGNNPVIIDEPEAHLDSSLIANYLVELIKEQKKQRQIIFATHNANFVLNADAELIIKLENIGGITNSISFAIEDLNHREDLLKLEGGKEAFKKREQKYNI